MLTKGDNNSVHDRGLYAQGENEQQLWLKRSDILGRARGYALQCQNLTEQPSLNTHPPSRPPTINNSFLPYVGMVTIALNDYPNAKYILVGLMALFVLTSKE